VTISRTTDASSATTGTAARRTAVVWCPDWALTAAGISPAEPAVIVRADLVIACTAAARDEGVRVGQKSRDAQRACPALRVLADDPQRDGREFCRVLTAVSDLVPRVEVVQPGLLAFPAAGPARYHGGEQVLAERVMDTAAAAAGGECWVGIADGLFAAALAARRGALVPAGRTPAFLAEHQVGVLGRPELVDLLHRLGLHTLGDFAALPPPEVLSRFGPDGARAHRLARGMDERPVAPSRPLPELAVAAQLDPPLVSVDAAAFAVRPLAEELHRRLTDHALVCTVLSIEAEFTGDGSEICARLWRHGTYSTGAIVDRLRWQLEGWLTAGGRGFLSRLRLAPEEVQPVGGEQLDLTGDDPERRAKLARSVARVQGLLGPYAVTVPVLGGGRDPASRVSWVPWDEYQARLTAAADWHSARRRGNRLPTRWPSGQWPELPLSTASRQRAVRQRQEGRQPWPDSIPPPYPATVHLFPPLAALVGDTGQPVRVDGRGALSEPPATLAAAGRRPVQVANWGGPWPADEWWWDHTRHRRRARLQVSTVDGRAFLLACMEGHWLVEAEYD
jgi:protein ImuB